MKDEKCLFATLLVLHTGACLACWTGQAWGADLKVVDPRYKAVVVAKDTALPGVNGATIGKDGALYVVHTATGSTTRIDLNTKRATTFVPPYSGMFITDDITSDDKGNFYITGTTTMVGEVYRGRPGRRQDRHR